MGENFALKWHSNNRQKYVICSNSDIESIIEKYTDNENFSADEKDLKQLIKLNPIPIVELTPDFCFIVWYEIGAHYGIYKRTYKITRNFPYRIELIDENRLVDINQMFFVKESGQPHQNWLKR